MSGTEPCPECGEEYDKKVSLSNRLGRSHDVSDHEKLCQTAERRQSYPTMKPTRVESEKYKFVGCLHK